MRCQLARAQPSALLRVASATLPLLRAAHVADRRSLPCCVRSLLPDGSCAEFSKIAQATSIGFAIMGFIGFFVKLIFIPINNIIVGMG